jgi:tetratricopeptide (TPR) repeat protein
MRIRILLLGAVTIATLTGHGAAGQGADPKTDPKTNFVQALARFSLELDGGYGDEGSRLWADLESMDRGLEQWDATVRTYEAAMILEIKGAEPRLAARMHAALGGVYLDRGRIEDALRELMAASDLDSTRADVYTLQGLAYNHPSARDPVAATLALQTASDLDPHNAVRSYALARQLMRVGKRQEAKKALLLLEDGLKQGRDQSRTAIPSPFVQLGIVQEKAGVEPFFPPALYAEGFALLQRGALRRAIAQFREAAGHDPLAANLVKNREAMGQAAAGFRDGLAEVAIEHLKVAIELAPNLAEAHRMLGRVYLANQQDEESVNELRAAVRLSPGDERSRLDLADALVEAERFPAAEQALRETLEAVPSSGRARYTLGRLYQRQSQFPEAVHELGEAATFNPLLGLNGIYQAVGAMNAARQNFDAAVDAYEKRVDVHPNDVDAHQDLGETYLRLGRHDEALAEFAVALMLHPEASAAYAGMAQSQLAEGHYADAVEASRRTLELDPAHKQARYTLGTSLMRLGRTDEGQRELRVFEGMQAEATAAQSRELELGGLKREASAASANGDHEKAVTLLRKALLLKPDAAVSHLNLGLALLRAGQPAEAVECFKSAVVLDAPIEVHRHLAAAYAALGQDEDSAREQALFERAKHESLRSRTSNR